MLDRIIMLMRCKYKLDVELRRTRPRRGPPGTPASPGVSSRASSSRPPPRASCRRRSRLAPPHPRTAASRQQPVTRGDIEDIRGVNVSTQTVRTLLERDWIKVSGYRDVPGRPALYATTPNFLNDFNLKKVTELPSLPEIQEVDESFTLQAI